MRFRWSWIQILAALIPFILHTLLVIWVWRISVQEKYPPWDTTPNEAKLAWALPCLTDLPTSVVFYENVGDPNIVWIMLIFGGIHWLIIGIGIQVLHSYYQGHIRKKRRVCGNTPETLPPEQS